jgi:hypothetical protein
MMACAIPYRTKTKAVRLYRVPRGRGAISGSTALRYHDLNHNCRKESNFADTEMRAREALFRNAAV